ncbi:hypothetical protein KC19_9G035900 [Ceratodon purpureus]|uniref:Uncharacterized protein n=1 Tax=Ceratodon purpureus TaxID=3225 RepID=A0A8T0GTU5_CERPU|nr:hypothetical protein KC19_9G035900 [Ceratodon purpureus]
MEICKKGRGYARNLAAMEEHLHGCYYESDEHYAHGRLNVHENEHSESESSANESPIGTQFNYSLVEVIHRPRGV